MPNVYGERVLIPNTAGHGGQDCTITLDMWRRANVVIPQNEVRNPNGQLAYPNGIGYYAITNQLFGDITEPTLMHDADIRRFVLEQFKIMHAYSWQSSVAFTNPRFEIQEVNKEGVLRRGRTPRTVPMLSVKPLRLPFLKSGIAAISLKDADERELCVPTAITHWLANRTGKNAKNKFMSKEACQKYPNALPLIKDTKGNVGKPKVTPENVTALLDAIHLANGNTDHGHTVEDVEEFVQLFGCKMIALNREGVVIGEVVDGDAHQPLCYTCAHGHMYWHCDAEDVKSIAECAKEQRMLGCKHYCAQGGAIVAKGAKEAQERKLQVVDTDEMAAILKSGEIAEPTSFLVRGSKDVEQLFFWFGWR